MSEIEKMYRTAKVVPSHHYCNDCQYDMSAECPIRCPDNVAVYPPFTAEKQIELIKWLAKRPLTLLIGRYRGKYYFGNSNFNSKADSFDNAIAIRINDLWQDLTEEEKQQVKGILE